MWTWATVRRGERQQEALVEAMKEKSGSDALAVLFLHARHSKDCFLRLAMAVRPQLRTSIEAPRIGQGPSSKRRAGRERERGRRDAHLADVDPVAVADVEHALLEEAGDTVCEHAAASEVESVSKAQESRRSGREGGTHSRSISPNRRPPSRERPSTGCLVKIWTGPRARAWICEAWSERQREPVCVRTDLERRLVEHEGHGERAARLTLSPTMCLRRW